MTYSSDSFKKAHAKYLADVGLDTWRAGLEKDSREARLSEYESLACDDVSTVRLTHSRAVLGSFLDETGSPIERLFGTALANVLGTQGGTTTFAFADGTSLLFSRYSDLIQWSACPQKPVGSYKADFFLELTSIRDHLTKTPFETRATASMIVECDGHDFHEKTKEQASHDKKRDRFMQEQGHLVFRFSGADIYRDPFACAMSCASALSAAAHRIHEAK